MNGVDLGAAGEEVVADLLAALDLTEGFEACLIVSERPDVLAEVRRRLAGHCVLARVAPSAAVVATTVAVDKTSRTVVWMETEPWSPAPWTQALSAMNRHRERLRKDAPCFFVLAGPPSLLELAQDTAPDLLSIATLYRRLPDPPAPALGARTFRWLHISDLHLTQGESWDRRATLQALVRFAETLRGEGPTPDAVFVTGDIAESGKPAEYDQALRLFHVLAEKLGLDPARRWFVVPGNHDVDRARVGPLDGAVIGALRDEDAVEQLLGHSATMRLMGERLTAFHAFTAQFLGAARGWQSDSPGRADIVDLDGFRVGVLQLDSAWASGSDSDDGGLLIGEAQVRNLLALIDGSHLRIALLHHPWSALREWDATRVRSLLHAPGGASFVLRGHLHRSDAASVQSPDGVVAELAAGATYTGGSWARRILTGEVDTGAGKGTVRFFGYGPNGRGFWRPDPFAFEGAPDGTWTFPLPPGLTAACATASAQLSEDGKESLRARYRVAAAATYGIARFVGLAAGARRAPNARIPDLFVPLSFQRHSRFAGPNLRPDPMSTEELLRRLLVRIPGHAPGRFVVLGDPGSGKTTLCRFATVVAAGAARVAGVDAQADCVPFYVAFRSYVHASRVRNLSLTDFLEEEARTHLSVHLPSGFVEEQLAGGRAVLLLDGLDEVGDAGERSRMRDRIAGFCAGWPEVPVLATSRVAGYDEAPLPDGPSDFQCLRLLPFDDASLDRFVRTWYAVQEPEDAVERDRRTGDLLAALFQDTRVLTLARNPLLATLIGLVHRHEAHLPAERAKLAELCVKTLIETWPAETRRKFRDLDEGQQRYHLEELAYWIQDERDDAGDVVISRPILVEFFTKSLSCDLDSPEKARRVAERWVAYLEVGTGLLVEQSPGVFAFVHLLLMEYLAACAWDRGEGDRLPAAIWERADDPEWEEVCLHAVARHETDHRFLGEFVSGRQPDFAATEFLLKCARDGAAFRPADLRSILDSAAKEMGQRRLLIVEYQTLYVALLTGSRRHAATTKEWLEATLREAGGDTLKGSVILALSAGVPAIQLLLDRMDVSDVAVGLLDLWIYTPVAEFAVQHSPGPALLSWAVTQCSEGDLVPFATGAFDETLSAAAGPAAVALVRNALGVGNPHHRSNQRQTARAKQNENAVLLHTGPIPAFPRYIASRAPLLGVVGEIPIVEWVASTPLTNLALGAAIGEGSRLNVSRLRKRGWAVRLFPHAKWDDLTSMRLENARLEPPPTPGTIAAWPAESWALDVNPRRRSIPLVYVADVLAGALQTVGLEQAVRAAVITRRLLSRALLVEWWPQSDHLVDFDTPNSLALYLALGWTQAVFTWRWPRSDRWQRVHLGDPPMHWWPRLHWHMCWLVHDPEDSAHRAEVRFALDEGLVDADPDARALAEVFDSWWLPAPVADTVDG